MHSGDFPLRSMLFIQLLRLNSESVLHRITECTRLADSAMDVRTLSYRPAWCFESGVATLLSMKLNARVLPEK